MVCDTLKKTRVSSQTVPVCTFKTSPCVRAPRAHVSTCARGAGIHGDVLDGHTEEGRREGSSSASCFSPVKQVFF